jgi:hypothetical protein
VIRRGGLGIVRFLEENKSEDEKGLNEINGEKCLRMIKYDPLYTQKKN